MNYKNNSTLKASHFFKSLILTCATICGLWTAPKCSSAQEAPATFGPLTLESASLVHDRSNSYAGPTTLPSGAISAVDPANQQTDKDDLLETPIYGCACGCGIFEVGTSSMLPRCTGGTAYFEYDYQDQNIDWSGNKPAPAADNPDKEVRTNFFTFGLQYMFDRNWGVQAEVPIDNRYFKTTGGASGSDIVSFNWATVGDVRIEGIYAGFSPDQSAGMTFGMKLPTGDFQHNDAFGDIDRDSEIGTGSTDILLGGFYRNNVTADGRLDWFAQLNFDLPVLYQDQYRPGDEVDGSLGIYYNGLSLGRVGITPIAQILASARGEDSGTAAASPIASGYERVLLSPGIEIDLHPVMLYADIEVPVYQRFNGFQMTAPFLVKMILSYKF
jgi:hypothetical protein